MALGREPRQAMSPGREPRQAMAPGREPLLPPRALDGVAGAAGGLQGHAADNRGLKFTVVTPRSGSDTFRRSKANTFGGAAPAIGFWGIVAMSFFNVSGGPWGSEDIFSTGGPAVGVVAIVLFALCFSVPQCLVTSELCCALPGNGGYAIWVREAFGDFWGYQEVYWQWVSGVADAAVYPVVICDTVLQLLGRENVGREEVWLWRMMVTTLLSLPTFVSISTVPRVLVAFAATTGAPVVAFIALGSQAVRPRVWLQSVSAERVDYGKLVNTIFWNLEGWDCISTCATYITAPREVMIPRGLFWALAFTVAQYLLVLLVAAGISERNDTWQQWRDGSLPSIGSTLGSWMGGGLLLASVVGNAGMYLSEFMEDSYLLQGAAEIGILPQVLRRQLPRSGAPYVANTLQFAIVSVAVVFDFGDIIVFDNFFSGAAVALQFLAFLVLRVRRPGMVRPYRVPTPALVLLAPGLALVGAMLYHGLTKSSHTLWVTLLAFALGVPYGGWIAWRGRQDQREGKRCMLDELLDDD